MKKLTHFLGILYGFLVVLFVLGVISEKMIGILFAVLMSYMLSLLIYLFI